MNLPLIENLLSSGAKAMNVNGATTPVVFSYSPGSNVTVAVRKLVVVLDDPGGTAFNKFGTLTALTNGLLVSATVGGQTYNLMNIKDNADLVVRCDRSHFGNSASDTLGAAVGFGDSYDAFVGTILLDEPIVLTGSSESIQVTVRDNLTSIATLQFAIGFLKQV